MWRTHAHGSEATKPTRRKCPVRIRRHGESPRGSVRSSARSSSALRRAAPTPASPPTGPSRVADAVRVDDRLRPRRRNPTATEPTDPAEPPIRRPRGHRRRPRRRPAGRHARLAGQTSEDDGDGDPRGARRLRRSRRRDVRAVRRPPPGRGPGQQDRFVARQPGWARASAAATSGCSPSSIYGEPLLERFDIVGWDPRGTGKSEPAIDCIDDYDAYYSGTDITPDDEAERQQLIDLAEGFADALRGRTTPTSSSTSGRTTAPGTWTCCARPSARTRSATSASATAASSGRRGRRCSRTPCGPPCSTGPADPNADPLESGLAADEGLRGHAGHLPRVVQRRHVVRRSTTMATPRAPSTRSMAELDEDPIPSEQGRPDVTRGMALAGRRPGDVLRDVLGPAVGGAGRRPSAATAPGSWRCTTRTTSATTTAPGATSWRPSRRSAAWTRPSA